MRSLLHRHPSFLLLLLLGTLSLCLVLVRDRQLLSAKTEPVCILVRAEVEEALSAGRLSEAHRVTLLDRGILDVVWVGPSEPAVVDVTDGSGRPGLASSPTRRLVMLLLEGNAKKSDEGYLFFGRCPLYANMELSLQGGGVRATGRVLRIVPKAELPPEQTAPAGKISHKSRGEARVCLGRASRKLPDFFFFWERP